MPVLYGYKKVDSEKKITTLNKLHLLLKPSSQCKTGEIACHGFPDLTPISKKSRRPRPKHSFTADLYLFDSNLVTGSSFNIKGTEFSFVCAVAEGAPRSTDILWESGCRKEEWDRCADSETAYRWGLDADITMMSGLYGDTTFPSCGLRQ